MAFAPSSLQGHRRQTTKPRFSAASIPSRSQVLRHRRPLPSRIQGFLQLFGQSWNRVPNKVFRTSCPGTFPLGGWGNSATLQESSAEFSESASIFGHLRKSRRKGCEHVKHESAMFNCVRNFCGNDPRSWNSPGTLPTTPGGSPNSPTPTWGTFRATFSEHPVGNVFPILPEPSPPPPTPGTFRATHSEHPVGNVFPIA